MIPLQEQERLREHFRERLTGGVKLEHVTQRPLSIVVPGREECRLCAEARQIVEELRALSPKISLRVHELSESPKLAADLGVERVPTTVLRGQLNRQIRFEGFFGGLLFPVMVETIIAVSRGATDLDPRTKRRLERIRDRVALRVIVSLSSPYAAAIMRTAFAFGLENQRLRVTVTEAEEFPRLVESLQVRAVPLTIIGERARLAGAIAPDAFVDQILKAGEQRALHLGGGLLGAALGPTTPLQPRAEPQASPSGLILPGR